MKPTPRPSRRRPTVHVSSRQQTLRIPRKRMAELAEFVARSEGQPLAEVDVAVVGRREMATLNRRHLGHRGATDVLSFDLGPMGATATLLSRCRTPSAPTGAGGAQGARSTSRISASSIEPHAGPRPLRGAPLRSLLRQGFAGQVASGISYAPYDAATGPARIVQIILCADVAEREARRRGHSPAKELLLYLAHGLLHVMGYDDHPPAAAARMHQREDELLESFGLGRVYKPQGA